MLACGQAPTATTSSELTPGNEPTAGGTTSVQAPRDELVPASARYLTGLFAGGDGSSSSASAGQEVTARRASDSRPGGTGPGARTG
jgi:hypothetical protein